MAELVRGGPYAAGVMLAIGGLVSLIGLFVHPLGEEVGSEALTRSIIVSQTVPWRVSHALLGFGFTFMAAAGLIVLAARSPVATGPVGMAGWSLLIMFSVPVFLVSLVESTVIVEVALAGDATRFHEWYSGLVAGVGSISLSFAFLGVALVAVREVRAASRLLPRWAAGLGAVGGFLAVSIGIGVVVQNPAASAGYLASLVAIGWLVALGIQLVRRGEAAGAPLEVMEA